MLAYCYHKLSINIILSSKHCDGLWWQWLPQRAAGSPRHTLVATLGRGSAVSLEWPLRLVGEWSLVVVSDSWFIVEHGSWHFLHWSSLVGPWNSFVVVMTVNENHPKRIRRSEKATDGEPWASGWFMINGWWWLSPGSWPWKAGDSVMANDCDCQADVGWYGGGYHAYWWFIIVIDHGTSWSTAQLHCSCLNVNVNHWTIPSPSIPEKWCGVGHCITPDGEFHSPFWSRIVIITHQSFPRSATIRVAASWFMTAATNP